jgi:membrane-bound lytic murein transglycosylase B
MKKIVVIVLAVITHGLWSQAAAVSLDDHEQLRTIAAELVAQQMYSKAELDDIFKDVEIQQSVLDAMMNPAEYRLTWGKYRKIFLGEERIQQGVEFWQEHAETLARAEKEYGVPASVIVAIIGVETKFGRIVGKHKVLDSLTTLSVGYPRRSKFFTKELKEFLLLVKENNLDPHAIVGSYAGAVGYPQFISSSYRHYAVDFSGDGVTDLMSQPIDAIGSVANYLKRNGWLTGGAVTSSAHITVAEPIVELANRERKTPYVADDLRKLGASIPTEIIGSEPLNVLMLDASEIVPDAAEKDHYIVRAGDTACEIAERFSVPCKQLFALNKLNDNGTIYRGQRLKLPKSAKTKSPPAKRVGKQLSKSSKWVVSQPVAKTDENATREPESSYVPMPRYFYTHPNFYAITEYNHSVLYAMAVYDLSVEIARAYSN